MRLDCCLPLPGDALFAAGRIFHSSPKRSHKNALFGELLLKSQFAVIFFVNLILNDFVVAENHLMCTAVSSRTALNHLVDTGIDLASKMSSLSS